MYVYDDRGVQLDYVHIYEGGIYINMFAFHSRHKSLLRKYSCNICTIE